jgi:hypothetical protein
LPHNHLDGIWDENILTQPMVQTMRTALAGKAVRSKSLFVKDEFRGGPIFPGASARLKSCFKPRIQFVRAFSRYRGNLKLRSPCSHLHYNPVRTEATFALSGGVEDFCCLPYWR